MNKGEKTSPLAPLAGSRARGEGRWDGLGGGGRRCRLREKGAFCERDPACCDHPSPGPHPRKRGEGGSFGSSGWRGRMEFSRALPGRSGGDAFLVRRGPGVLARRASLHPRLSFFRPSRAGERARGRTGLGGGGRITRRVMNTVQRVRPIHRPARARETSVLFQRTHFPLGHTPGPPACGTGRHYPDPNQIP